jgi:hypothetical protein
MSLEIYNNLFSFSANLCNHSNGIVALFLDKNALDGLNVIGAVKGKKSVCCTEKRCYIGAVKGEMSVYCTGK